jgi:hypothetical protein
VFPDVLYYLSSPWRKMKLQKCRSLKHLRVTPMQFQGHTGDVVLCVRGFEANFQHGLSSYHSAVCNPKDTRMSTGAMIIWMAYYRH